MANENENARPQCSENGRTKVNTPIKCNRCGTLHNQGDRYCSYCGQRLFLRFEELSTEEQTTVLAKTERFIDHYLHSDSEKDTDL